MDVESHLFGIGFQADLDDTKLSLLINVFNKDLLGPLSTISLDTNYLVRIRQWILVLSLEYIEAAAHKLLALIGSIIPEIEVEDALVFLASRFRLMDESY